MFPDRVLQEGKGSLKPTDIWVYLALRSHYDETKQLPVFPSRKRLSELVGCSVDTIDRSVKRLTKNGFVTLESGHSGLSNRYQFVDRKPNNDSRTRAATGYATTQRDTSNDEQKVAAFVQHQSDLSNQNHQTQKTLRLYHGSDLASVQENGEIRIRTHTGSWVDYPGGDDDRFRFGGLYGKSAKNAALAAYSKNRSNLSSYGKD